MGSLGLFFSLFVASDEISHEFSGITVVCVAVDHPHFAELPLGVAELGGFDCLKDHELFVNALLLKFHHSFLAPHVAIVLHVFDFDALLDTDLVGLVKTHPRLLIYVVLLNLCLNFENTHLVSLI